MNKKNSQNIIILIIHLFYFINLV